MASELFHILETVMSVFDQLRVFLVVSATFSMTDKYK